MTVLKNQGISQKPCACGRGMIYTGERGKNLNPKIDGKAVCEECVVDKLYAQYFADKHD